MSNLSEIATGTTSTTNSIESIDSNNNNDDSFNVNNKSSCYNVIVSAPGKMLIAGGYLVLDEMNIGLVIGVTARFYSSCYRNSITTTTGSSEHGTTTSSTTTTTTATTKIRVISPQFQQEWYYSWDRTSYTLHEVEGEDFNDTPTMNDDNNNTPTTTTKKTTKKKKKKNPFLEKALRIVLLYIYHPNNQNNFCTNNNNNNNNNKSNNNHNNNDSFTITIVGDNDFYSLVPHLQQRQLCKTQIHLLPKCLPVMIHNNNSSNNNNKSKETTNTTADSTTTTTTTTGDDDDDNEDEGEIYKTGLGSSACLVTAVIGSIIYATTSTVSGTPTPTAATAATTTTTTYHNHNDDDIKYTDNVMTEKETTTTQPTTTITTIIERLSQIGHCYGQGKVGSGFDVAAAMYGSHIYQRFSPHILTQLLSYMDEIDVNVTTGTTTTTTSTNMSEHIMSTMNVLYTTVHDDSLWKSNTIEPITCFHTTTFLQVMMADVSGGSESPSMAKQILSWRNKYIQQQQNDHPSNDSTTTTSATKVPHWDDLSMINRQIIRTLQQIHTIVPTADITIQQLYVDTPYNEWNITINTPLTQLLITLKDLYIQQRYHMKQMGIVAGDVPIEPDVQTSLCNDVTNHVPGVLATMVPGAGGYDAISIIYINTTSVQSNITNYLASYSEQNLCALSVHGIAYNDGLRIETEFPI